MTPRDWMASISVLLLAGDALAAPVFLTVQVQADEDRLVVLERLDVAGDLTGMPAEFPFLRPEAQPGPRMVARSENAEDGVEVEASGPVRTAFTGTGLALSPVPGEAGDVQVMVRFALPIERPDLTLMLSADRPIDRVRFITRQTAAYGPQLRPLAPVAVSQEVEEDGTYVTQTVLNPIPAGARLPVVLRHLPAPFGPYRVSALAGVVLAVLGVGIVLIRGRSR